MTIDTVPIEPDLAKEFRDYVYGVSHDVSAPVRTMVEFSRLLTDEHAHALNEEGRLYLSLIIDSGEKLHKMMTGLLDYSRLNTEAKPLEPMDCNAALHSSLRSLAGTIAATGAQIEIQTLPEIVADSRQITQLFTALISNALVFQPKTHTPQVTIAAKNRGDMVVFSVTDNGIGIDERYHHKVFQVFQRLHADKEYAGVGMGLTLAQKIVRRHNGDIWIESMPHQGTTVSFSIPIRHSEPQHSAA